METKRILPHNVLKLFHLRKAVTEYQVLPKYSECPFGKIYISDLLDSLLDKQWLSKFSPDKVFIAP